MQFFKGDEKELKFYNSGLPILNSTSNDRTEFFNDAFACFALGDLLYDTGRAPLTNAIKREIFREAFATIFNAFLTAGSFESYLTVFRTIFGDDVQVTFTVPSAGRLQIAIVAAGVQYSTWVARTIVGNSYVFDEIIDDEGDNLVFQSVKGFETQYEVEQMLFEMVPDGIFTEISLTLL